MQAIMKKNLLNNIFNKKKTIMTKILKPCDNKKLQILIKMKFRLHFVSICVFLVGDAQIIESMTHFRKQHIFDETEKLKVKLSNDG